MRIDFARIDLVGVDFVRIDLVGAPQKDILRQKRKHSEMAFLTSRSASKHVLFALGVRDARESGAGSDLVS